jgi:hypothetical protein
VLRESAKQRGRRVLLAPAPSTLIVAAGETPPAPTMAEVVASKDADGKKAAPSPLAAGGAKPAAAAPPAPKQVAFTRLFRFATRLDLVLYAIAAVCAAFCGVIMPLFAILFGACATGGAAGALLGDSSAAAAGPPAAATFLF